MNKIMLVFVALATFISTSSVTITFDDLNPALSAEIPNGYGGLFWQNIRARDGLRSPPGGFVNGTVSPRNVAYADTGGTEPVTISAERPFDADKVYLTAASDDNLSVRITGFLNRRLRFSRVISLNTRGPTLVTLNFRGVTSVQFSSVFVDDTTGIFAMDNLSITWPLADTGSIHTLSQFQPYVSWGGRAVAVAINPANEAEALVASESGGLFRTTDRGSTWRHVDSLPMFRLIDVAYAPDGRAVIVTGQPTGDTEDQGGIWRSVDNGVRWERPSTWQVPGRQRGAAYGIAFEPASDNVYVGTYYGLAVSNDRGATWHSSSNANNEVYTVTAQRGGIVDIGSEQGHQRSIDHGERFAPISFAAHGFGNAYVHSLAHHPSNPNVIYAVYYTPGGRLALFEGTQQPSGAFTWRQASPAYDPGAGRTPFVVAALSRLGVPEGADIYFHVPGTLVRQAVTRLGLLAEAGWMPLADPNHGDQNALATSPRSGLPVFLANDGGIDRAVAQSNPELAGSAWEFVGKGTNGYNALQLYDVAGQVRADGALNLYFGAQDNWIWASPDGGTHWPGPGGVEGGHFQMNRYERPSGTPIIQYVDFGFNGGNVNFRSGPLWEGKTEWNNPPPEFLGAATDSPLLLAPTLWMQYHHIKAIAENPASTEIYVSSTDGATWTRVGSFPYEPAHPGPQAARVGNDITVYQAILDSGRTGLIKIAGLRADGSATSVSILRADIGLGSIGGYCMGEGGFICPTVWAVDPNDPNRLMAVDADSQTVKFTTTGGESWITDANLTDLVTVFDDSTGRRAIRMTLSRSDYETYPLGSASQVHVIRWDPERRGRIFVGTESVGIYFSENDGRTWQIVLGSGQVTAAAAFYFEKNGTRDRAADNLYVATYGRGLWKVRMPLSAPCPFLHCDPIANPWSVNYSIFYPILGTVIDFQLFIDPEFCPICRWVVVDEGEIRDMRLDNDGRLISISIDKGRLVTSSADGVPLSSTDWPVTLSQEAGLFEGCPGCATAIKAGKRIKGFIVENDILKGFIAGQGEFTLEPFLAEFFPGPAPFVETPPVEPSILPYLQIASEDLPGRLFAAGSEVKLLGFNFCAAPGCGPVDVRLDGLTLGVASPNQKGNFQFSFQAPQELGIHIISVAQDRADGDKTEQSITFVRPVIEKEEDEEGEDEPFHILLSGPASVNANEVRIAAVIGSDNELPSKISYSVDGGLETVFCSKCDQPLVNFFIELELTDECVPHTATVSVTDADGKDTFKETLTIQRDVTPPVIAPQPDIQVQSDGLKPIPVFYNLPAAVDNCGRPVSVASDPPAGSLFPAGETRVTVTAIDATGNTAQSAFTVKVISSGLSGAFSVAQHGGAGAIRIPLKLSDSPTSDPRARVTEIVALFGGPVRSGMGDLSPEKIVITSAAGNTVPAFTVAFAEGGNVGQELHLLFVTPLPDQDRYRISFQNFLDNDANVLIGDTDVEFRVLQGDANGSGTVTAADISFVRGHINETAAPGASVRADVNSNGIVTATDLSFVRARIGHSSP